LIPINFGDLSQRARRAFKLVGRLPLSLDETVLPVAVVAQLDQDPYRAEPRTWSWPATLTGTAVLSGLLEVGNPSTSSQLITVTGFVASPSVNGSLTWGIVRGAAGLLAAGISQPVLLNTPNGFLGQPGQSATRFRSGQNAAINAGAVGQVQAAALVPFQIQFNNPVVLYPGDLFWLATQVTAVVWTVALFGAEYVLTSP
jgi:hypothetical protein